MTGDGAGPMAEIERWVESARLADPASPVLMALCTLADDGGPRIRSVPLRGVDRSGVWFHTDRGSDKAADLTARAGQVAGLLSWPAQGREIRLRGGAEFVSAPVADREFARRSRADQLWSWVVARPGELASTRELQQRIDDVQERFRDADVVRPPSWCPVVMAPRTVEFFEVSSDRLHERCRFDLVGSTWRMVRLVP